jgi:hypothetical protein
MKIKPVDKYNAFIKGDIIGDFPIVYQSISGLVRTDGEMKEATPPPQQEVKQYRSNQIAFFPFYKDISKMYAR